MAGCEPMDVDSEYEDKENFITHSQKIFNVENVEELDTSEVNMKLRMSCTPMSSPLSQSLSNSKKFALESGDNSLNKVTSAHSILHSSGDFSDSSLPAVNSTLSGQNSVIDNNNKNNTLIQNDVQSVSNNNVTVTINADKYTPPIDHLLESEINSSICSIESTSPIAIAAKPDQVMATSPIMRGLKSVFNMFRPSQSPIQPESQVTTSKTPDFKSSSEISDKSVLASTPVSDSKSISISSSTSQKQGINFNDDLVPDLQWNEEDTIIFSNDKVPIQKLFSMSQSCTTDSPLKKITNDCEPIEISINAPFDKHSEDNISVMDGKLNKNNSEFYDCSDTDNVVKGSDIKNSLPKYSLNKKNIEVNDVDEQFSSFNKKLDCGNVSESDLNNIVQKNHETSLPINDLSFASKLQIKTESESKDIKDESDSNVKFFSPDMVTDMPYIEKAAIMAASVVAVITPYSVPSRTNNSVQENSINDVIKPKLNLTDEVVPSLDETKEIYCETNLPEIVNEQSTSDINITSDSFQLIDTGLENLTEGTNSSNRFNNEYSSEMLDKGIQETSVIIVNKVRNESQKTLVKTENILNYSIKDINCSPKKTQTDYDPLTIGKESPKKNDEDFIIPLDIVATSLNLKNPISSENVPNVQNIQTEKSTHLTFNNCSNNQTNCDSFAQAKNNIQNSIVQSKAVVSLEKLSLEVLKKNKSVYEMMNDDAHNMSKPPVKSNDMTPYNAKKVSVTCEKYYDKDQNIDSNESSLYVSLKTTNELDMNDYGDINDQKFNCIDEIQNTSITKIKDLEHSKVTEAHVGQPFDCILTGNIDKNKSLNEIINNQEIYQSVYTSATENILDQQTNLDSENASEKSCISYESNEIQLKDTSIENMDGSMLNAKQFLYDTKENIIENHVIDNEVIDDEISIASISPETCQNETVIEVNTEDVDTIEGPFDDDIANLNNDKNNELDSFEKEEREIECLLKSENVDITSNTNTENNFLAICNNKFSELAFTASTDSEAETTNIEVSQLQESPDLEDDFKSGEIFINAEDFDFLMNKNCPNEINECGKESLFLKFDPLCAQPVPTNVVVTTSQINSSEIEIKTDETRTVIESADNAVQNVLNLQLENSCPLDETLTSFKGNIPERPVMAVTPAVNSKPLMSRNNLISVIPNACNNDQPEQNYAQTPQPTRQPNVCTSPAIAAIDQLISLSGNNTPISSSTLRLQQNQGGMDSIHQLTNHLAEKEQQLQYLREESKDLKNRLIKLESQMKSLEADNSERINNIDVLNAKLASKSKVNQEMAIVVEEYERTIASLIRERDEDRIKHEQERSQLIQERDEQSAHLASMEVSFNDLHSKYEKSKQIIYSYKSNEDVLRKMVEQHEENLKKMNENYELLKQHATAKLNNSNMELEKIKKSHNAEVLKLTALLKRKDLHISSLEETVAQKSKANEELTAICDELIAKVE